MKINNSSRVRKTYSHLVLLIVICSFIFSACAPTAYFKTPNDVNKMKGTIYMEDGTVKNGLITALFENKDQRQKDCQRV